MYARKMLNTMRLGVVGLLLGLALLHPVAAQTIKAICASGYALWANGQTRNDTLILSGSNTTINGAVRSNADFRISGSNNRITGSVEYRTLFQNGGDNNSYPAPTQVAADAPPVSYAIADYRPGGAAAVAAQSAGRYTAINGDLDVSDTTVLNGLYYVTGNAKLAASDLRGTFTLVAEGFIDVSGSKLQVSPYANGLLFFSNRQEIGASIIKLAGSDSILPGVVYAPGGTIELSGSKNINTGVIVGDALKLSGSSLMITFDSIYCQDPTPPPPDTPSGDYAPDEVIVKLFNASDLPAVAQTHGLNPVALGQFGARPIFRLRIVDGTDPLVKANQIRPAGGSDGDSRVEYAEPNFTTQTPEGRRGRGSWVIGEDAGGYADQWAPGVIRLAEAHTVSRGSGVTVAVLDTGVDVDHPALAGRLAPGFDFVNFDNDPREEGTYGVNLGYGHGTHVAGLVALTAPEARIMPVRVLDPDGMGNIWVLSEGLLFAVEQGPDRQPLTGDEAQVVNLSLGTLRRTQLLEDLVAEATCATNDDDDDDDDDSSSTGRCAQTGGVVVIAAAGNGGDTAPQYPAAEAVDGSLAVGASTLADTRAEFSTYGAWVQLAAPGETIVSTVPGGGYGTWSGTSMAAPLTAGAAALVRSANSSLRATAVTGRLIQTADTISGPIPKRLDVGAALGVVSQRDSEHYYMFLPTL